MKNRFSRGGAFSTQSSSGNKQNSSRGSARDYFDDDDDETPSVPASHTSMTDDPDFDPLDAYMYVSSRYPLIDLMFYHAGVVSKSK